MKITSSLLAGGMLATLALASCSKNDTLQQLADISFYHTYEQAVEAPFPNPTDTVIPANIPEFILPPYVFATNIQQIATDFNTSPEKLVSVKLDSLFLGGGTSRNLDFINSLKLYLSAKGLPELLAAEKSPVPKGIRTVALDVKAGELKEYFLKDSISLRIVASLNGIPPATTKLNMRNVVKIVANPLK